MAHLTITVDYAGELRVELDQFPERNQQKLIKLELRDGPKTYDTLYIQLELSKGEQGTSKEVLDRLANREAPFTHMRIRN